MTESLSSNVMLFIAVVHLVGVVVHRLAAPCRKLRVSHRLTLFMMAASATVIAMAIGQELLVGRTVVRQEVLNFAWSVIVLSLTVIAFGSRRLVYRRTEKCQNPKHSLAETSWMR